MDSLTHIAVGAVMGDAIAGHRLGRKAMLLGALFQTIPDFDVVAAAWMDLPHELVAHRGFTHSLLFVLLLSAVIGWLAPRWLKKQPMTTLHWFLFAGAEMLTHLFLDGFNNYGTGWLEPFSHHRFSFNAIYVVDPFFTLLPLVGMVVLWIAPLRQEKRILLQRLFLLLPALYLGYALFNKSRIEKTLRATIAAKFSPAENHFSTPAPFNTWLWFVVVKKDSGFYYGYRSVFDRSDSIDFHFVNAHRSWLQSLADDPAVQTLKRFSQGFYTVDKKGDSLVFSDLRFGQIAGWSDPTNPFVFYYYLNHPEGNELIVQRGRLAGWNGPSIRKYWERVKGK